MRATTVPQHTRCRSRKNSSRCASGTVACEEGEWSAFGPKTLFAIGRQVRAGLDSATAQEGTPRRTESAIAARSLFEATEMYPGAERWPPGYSGRMPARSPQTPAAQRLNPARPHPGSGTPILPSDCLSRDRSHKRSRLDLSSGRRRPKEDGGVRRGFLARAIGHPFQIDTPGPKSSDQFPSVSIRASPRIDITAANGHGKWRFTGRRQ